MCEFADRMEDCFEAVGLDIKEASKNTREVMSDMCVKIHSKMEEMDASIMKIQSKMEEMDASIRNNVKEDIKEESELQKVW